VEVMISATRLFLVGKKEMIVRMEQTVVKKSQTVRFSVEIFFKKIKPLCVFPRKILL